MTAPQEFPSVAKIAGCDKFAITRQRVHQLVKTHGRAVMMNPDALFPRLLENRRSGLRQALASPAKRRQIHQLLSQLTQ